MFKSKKEAEAEGLVQLSTWCANSDYELDYLTKERDRIASLPGRKASLVKNAGMIALYVNDQTGRRKA